MATPKSITPGGVDEYIASCPPQTQSYARRIRKLIQQVAPDATETVSYFQIPGYAYQGYDYNGMFVWFSCKPTCVRLHLRPPVIDDYEQQLAKFSRTKSIVSFPINQELPETLITQLVQASLDTMRETAG